MVVADSCTADGIADLALNKPMTVGLPRGVHACETRSFENRGWAAYWLHETDRARTSLDHGDR
jgi:hypothetical protein